MKILIVPDVKGWAIDQLAQAIIQFNKHFEFKIFYLGPRDAVEEKHQKEFEAAVNDFSPDIIHFMYYRSGIEVMKALPFLKTYKVIISHQNQRTKALRYENWKEFGITHLTTCTKKAKDYIIKHTDAAEELITSIRYGIDLNYFQYNDKEPEENAIGYAGRIVPWKGLKEVGEAAQELGFPLMFMGRQDKMDYWDTISETAKENMNFSFMDCADEDRLNYYHSLKCFVNFSKDWYEEGTLEYLEAMAAGVPVITTPCGLAGELAEDGKNCLLVPYEDKDALKVAIKKIMDDESLRNTLRKGGWDTVKNMSRERMAWDWSKLYYKINSKHDLVSVIIPTTYSRFENTDKILTALNKQSYRNIEVILALDEPVPSKEQKEEIYKMDKGRVKIPIKFVWTGVDKEVFPYNLAKARNLAAIEAQGEYLMFNDSRLEPDEHAIEVFLQTIKTEDKKTWMFGEKGGNKMSFVENFSFVKREDFINFGMMNEEIDRYGGMSQEIRTRWIAQGGQFCYIPTAEAKELNKASKSNQRMNDIIYSKMKLYKMYGDKRY